MPRTIVLYAALALATFALMLGGHNAGSARAGTAAPNVAGKWEGTWKHPAGQRPDHAAAGPRGHQGHRQAKSPCSDPVVRRSQPQIPLGTEVREGHLEDSTLIFYVTAPDTPGGRVNFTLTVSEQTMTGTACGYTCATLKLKKAPF